MSLKKIQTAQAPAAIGPYSQAIDVGPMVFCSGQIPLNPDTMTLEPADIRVQTQRVLSNLKAVLLAAGLGPKNIVKTTVFLINLGDFEAFNSEYSRFFTESGVEVPPARSTIQVSALPKGSMVEVEAIAWRG